MAKTYKVHRLNDDGSWTYPMCYRIDGKYFKHTTHEHINNNQIYNVEIKLQ